MLLADLAPALLEGGATEFRWGRSFEASYLDKRKTYPDLDARYEAFVSLKSHNIMTPFGKNDYPFGLGTGMTLAGYMHCHLKPDALLIYRRDGSVITMVYVATHREIRDKNAAVTVKKF